jgi:hypothetical protein
MQVDVHPQVSKNVSKCFLHHCSKFEESALFVVRCSRFEELEFLAGDDGLRSENRFLCSVD